MISIKKLLNLEFYTSQTDLFLAEYDHQHPRLSHSQHKEKEKSSVLSMKRDHATPPAASDKLWDQF